jgi:hypothetical protein
MGLVDLIKSEGKLLGEEEKGQLLTHIINSAYELDEVIRKIVRTSQETL